MTEEVTQELSTEESPSADLGNNADSGDSDFQSALDEAGISEEDIEGEGVSAKDFDKNVQSEKKTKKISAKEKANDDILKNILKEAQGPEDEEHEDLPENDEDIEEKAANDPLLGQINKMNLSEDGEKFNVSSKEELKELVQKGKNYTKKTQALSNEKKEFEALKEQAITEYNNSTKALQESANKHQEELKQFQVWDLALQQIAQDDPDLYQELQNRVKQSTRFFENPVANAQFRMLNEKIAHLEQGNKARESENVQKQFDIEMQSFAPQISQIEKELSIKVDREKVLAKWKALGGTVAEAIGALYADNILKMRASRSKVEKTNRQVNSMKAGGVPRRGGGASLKPSKVDWNQPLDKIVGQLSQMLG